MEKKMLFEKLFKILNVLLLIFSYLGFLAIIFLHIDAPFFPILFLFDFYLFYGQRLFLEKVCKIEWNNCIHNEEKAFKYIYAPTIFIEAFVILYYHEYSFHIIKEMTENFINNQS